MKKITNFNGAFSSSFFSFILLSLITFSARSQWTGHSMSTDLTSDINRTGNVGIGTAPSGKLSLYNSSGNIGMSIQSGSNSRFWIGQNSTTNVLSIGGTGNTFPGTGPLNIISGNVGIGMTPSEKLHVAGNLRMENNGGITFNTTETDPYNHISFKLSGATKWLMDYGTGTSQDFRIVRQTGTTLTTMMHFDYDNLNVGIGTATPDLNSKLTVNGKIKTAGVYSTALLEVNGIAGILVQGGGKIEANGGHIVSNRGIRGYGNTNDNGIGGLFYGTGSSGPSVYASNNVGTDAKAIEAYTEGNGTSRTALFAKVGIFNSGGYAAWLEGLTHCSDGVWASSDKKLKENDAKITGALDKLNSLKPITYNYKQNTKITLPKGKKAGFFAQDLQIIFPELVRSFKAPNYRDSLGNEIVREEEYLGVDYTSLIPYLVAAIQEQSKEIETLKAEKNTKSLRIENAEMEEGNSFKLYQNSPNPFDRSTTIKYFVPSTQKNANIYLYNFNGEQINKFPITSAGEGKIDINGGSLKAGIYIYSLIVDGKEIETKRMILTR